jgi:hypothetical protein
VQVADCWHLMENASRAFLVAVRKSMRHIRQVIGSATINPDLLTCAEHIQYEGYLRREETNATVMALARRRAPGPTASFAAYRAVGSDARPGSGNMPTVAGRVRSVDTVG